MNTGDNVAPFPVIHAEEAASDMVARLERALELVRNGELSAVAIAFVYRDGTGGSIWSELPSRIAMLGSISRMSYLINDEWTRA